MSRERMVTRTVNEVVVKVLAMDVTTCEVTKPEYTLSGEHSEETALKAIKKRYETETYKIVAIQEMTTKEVLLGMTEEEFLKYAKVLPPRTKVD